VDNYPTSTKNKFCGKSPFIRTVRHYTTSTNRLPIVRIFKDLHITANLERAKASLKGLSGIYCFRHITSGKIYIGQALNLSVRLMMHINGHNSNIHLQRAIKKYGLEAFEFIVVEFVEDTSLLTTREQVHLDWLFSVSSELRHNICPTAESRLGTTHTAESKALMSKSQQQVNRSGENHPIHGKTHTAETKAAISATKLGTTHTAETKAKTSESIIGNTNGRNQPSSKSVYVYDPYSRKLVGEFPSQVQASNSLQIPYTTLLRYLANGKVWNNKYIIRTSPFSSITPAKAPGRRIQ
jgi:group I intron endonuclease